MNNLGVMNTASKNFDNTDIVNTEFAGAFWNGIKTGFGDEISEQVFEAELFRGDRCLHALEYFVMVI